MKEARKKGIQGYCLLLETIECSDEDKKIIMKIAQQLKSMTRVTSQQIDKIMFEAQFSEDTYNKVMDMTEEFFKVTLKF